MKILLGPVIALFFFFFCFLSFFFLFLRSEQLVRFDPCVSGCLARLLLNGTVLKIM